jgi:hypothetical protein
MGTLNIAGTLHGVSASPSGGEQIVEKNEG